MTKKITACLFMALIFCLNQIPAAAIGFKSFGGYTDTKPVRYFLMTDEPRIVYNKQMTEDPDFLEVWTGSDLYIPIGAETTTINSDDDEETEEAYATSKQIKEHNVEISYKALVGGQFIDNVSIVDGKKDKIKELPTGSYVKIEFVDHYTGVGYVEVSLALVLSVNKVSYQDTRVELDCDLVNREEWIDRRSVYGAQVPTRYRVSRTFNEDVTFDFGGGITYTAMVKEGARYALGFSREEDYDLSLMYPDAYLEYYSFLGSNDTFESKGTLLIPISKQRFNNKEAKAPRVYAYEILDSRQLRALAPDETVYDSQKSVLHIRTNTLANYLLSNIKLLKDVDDDIDQTFQSGYASREDFPSLAEHGSSAQDAKPVSPSSTAASSSSLYNQTAIATTSRISDPPEDADPVTPVSAPSEASASESPVSSSRLEVSAPEVSPPVAGGNVAAATAVGSGGKTPFGVIGVALFALALCGAMLQTGKKKK